MSNILILHSGLSGITNACLELANRMQVAGHHVYTASIKDRKEKIESNGYTYVRVNPIQFDYRQSRQQHFLQYVLNAFFFRRKYFSTFYENLNFSAFDGLLKMNAIDIVLVDMELHEYILHMSSVGIRFLLISQWFTNWRTEGTLPLDSTAVPSSGLQQKLLWQKHTIRGFFKTVGNQIKTLGLNRRNFILYLADKLNVKRDELQSYQFPLPFIYRNFPVMTMTHPGLEFNVHSRSDLFYAYPMVFADRKEQVSDVMKKDIDTLLKQKKKEDKKLIVVTRTTMPGESAGSFNVLLKALAMRGDSISIVAMGDNFSAANSMKMSDNVYVYKSVPLMMLLKHANLSINHGGIHTINECIHFSVPMLVASGNKFDQNGCAARTNHFGCGISKNVTTMTPEEINTVVDEIMNTEIYAEKMRQLNRSYKKAKSNKVVAQFVEKQLHN